MFFIKNNLTNFCFCVICFWQLYQKGFVMTGYVGSSKKCIENLIDVIQEPKIDVERYQFEKTTFVYQFSKGKKRLFSIFVYESLRGDLVKMSIISNSGVSDFICDGDEGYRKACVLYQLAKRMYDNSVTNAIQKQPISPKVIRLCIELSRTPIR